MPQRVIARVSNYDHDNYQEAIVNVGAMPDEISQQICQLLNKINSIGEDYYTPMPVGYKPKDREY